jgi:hypothetical protein
MRFTRRALILLGAGLAAAGCMTDPGGLNVTQNERQPAPAAAVAPVAAPVVEPVAEQVAEQVVVDVPVEAPVEPPLTLIYGDSLTFESLPYLGGPDGNVKAYPGTALCDWVEQIKQDVVERGADRVIVAFSGNSFTPCMTGIDWAQDVELAQKYAADLAGLRAAVAPVPVLWARTPVKRDCCNGLQSLPYDIDAGAAVENADGTYADVLDGEQVRHNDGVHFCPAPGKFVAPCAVYSPGSARFAAALLSA